MEEEEYDSESTIVGDELLDANIPTLSSENTKRQSRWVEGVWNHLIGSLYEVDPEMFKKCMGVPSTCTWNNELEIMMIIDD